MNESPSTPSGFRFRYRWPWIDTTSAIAAASHICPRQVDAYIDQLSVANRGRGRSNQAPRARDGDGHALRGRGVRPREPPRDEGQDPLMGENRPAVWR